MNILVQWEWCKLCKAWIWICKDQAEGIVLTRDLQEYITMYNY